jgi:glycosyltransferase involved in cell wall biosynthesis
MNLLWIFPDFAVGGSQRRAATLINELGSEFSHTIVSQDGSREAEQFIAARTWRAHPVSLRKSSFIAFSNFTVMRRTFEAVAPDLLLTNNWGTLEWSIANRGLKRIPEIHFEDGFGPDESPARQNLKRVLARRLVLAKSVVVVPSRALESLAHEKWRLPRSRVFFIPNGVDVARFTGAPKSKRAGDLVIGSVGALRPEKNFARLVRAAATARRNGAPVRLEIFGEGADRAAIELEAKRSGLGPALSLPGASLAPEMAFASFDIFALSSDTEQMPLSLMEAMAAGLPVAATDVGDIRNMVSAENRDFIVMAGDDETLAAALSRLAADGDLRRRLGEANAAKAKAEFGLERMILSYRRLFADVVAERRSDKLFQ